MRSKARVLAGVLLQVRALAAGAGFAVGAALAAGAAPAAGATRAVPAAAAAEQATAEAHRDDAPPVIFFGDGLSDPGNYFLAYRQAAQAPFAAIPRAPYPIDHHYRFTNGPTWAEQVAELVGSPASGKPALRARHFTNYAVGRARARSNAPGFSEFDLGTQVGLFLTASGGHASHEAAYAIWVGQEDIYDAFQALTVDPSGVQSAGIVQQALAAVSDNIKALWSAGARDFLVLNVPDLGFSPVVREAGPDAQRAASRLTAAYNAGLHHAVEALSALANIRVNAFDTDTLMHLIVMAPQEFGLTDVEHPCLRIGAVDDPVCEDPEQHFYWDGIYPTTRGHQIVAHAVLTFAALKAAHREFVSIDFRTFPDGTLIPQNIDGEYGAPGTTLRSPVNTQFESLGVVFDSPSDHVGIIEGPPSCGFCRIPPVGGLLYGGDAAGDVHFSFLVKVRSVMVEIIGSGLNISASLRAFNSSGSEIATRTHTYTGSTGILSPFTVEAPPGETIAKVIFNGALNGAAVANMGRLTYETVGDESPSQP